MLLRRITSTVIQQIVLGGRDRVGIASVSHFRQTNCDALAHMQLLSNYNSITGYELPTHKYQLPLTYTCPSLRLVALLPKIALTPTWLNSDFFAKLDPSLLRSIPMEAPAPRHTERPVKKEAIRRIVIRRWKMNKHKRLKRMRKNRVLKLKKQAAKKQRAEKSFRQRCAIFLNEAQEFKAEQFVKEFLEKVHWKPPHRYNEFGRKVTPHWTELMTWEQLYGVPETDYIDKHSCLPEPEDLQEIKRQKELAENRKQWLLENPLQDVR